MIVIEKLVKRFCVYGQTVEGHMDKHIEMLGNIRTKEEFLHFMQLYTDATQEASVKQYLEALTAWAADMEGYYQNAHKPVPENINWDFIATLLYAGSIYE